MRWSLTGLGRWGGFLFRSGSGSQETVGERWHDGKVFEVSLVGCAPLIVGWQVLRNGLPEFVSH